METLELKLASTESRTNITSQQIKQVLSRYAYWSVENNTLDYNFRGGSCSFCEGEDINDLHYQA